MQLCGAGLLETAPRQKRAMCSDHHLRYARTFWCDEPPNVDLVILKRGLSGLLRRIQTNWS